MFDTNFFYNTLDLKDAIIAGDPGMEPGRLADVLADHMSEDPFVFNIETTNACNMACIMCPRPKLMTRKVRHLDQTLFKSVIDQLCENSAPDLERFWQMVPKRYGLTPDSRSENAFYFYQCSRALTLHGYGEPLLDPFLVDRVQTCTQRGIPTYFSCVPANAKPALMKKLMQAGLGVVKFSMEAFSDEEQKRIRGKCSDFTHSMTNIHAAIAYRNQMPEIDTRIVVTLISLSASPAALALQDEFMDFWADYPVYAYVKSQDNQWYYKDREENQNVSHYVTQYCEFPWTSLTVLSDGEVVPCTQDYNAEMTMGNLHRESLRAIWNGDAYAAFRHAHVTGEGIERYKCAHRCDLPKIYQRLKRECQPS